MQVVFRDGSGAKTWEKVQVSLFYPVVWSQQQGWIRVGWMFSHTHRPYSAVKLSANALLPPGVFLLSCMSTSRPMLLLRALLKMFPEGSLCSIGAALHCSEIDWLIMLSYKAKLLPSAAHRTAKLILSSKSQEQCIIHAFSLYSHLNRESHWVCRDGLHLCRKISWRIWGVLSVSVHSQSGTEMKGVCCALEGTAEDSGLPCTQNKQHSCSLFKSLSVSC